MRQLIDKTIAANKAAYLLRLKDFEKYRIGKGYLLQRLQARLGAGVTIKTQKLSTTINSEPAFNALDAEATRSANSGITGFDAAFVDVCQAYRADDLNHWTALQSAREALEAAHCKIPGGTLKKRSLAAF